MRLQIISPEKVVFKGEVTSVLVPGTKGDFEILKDHAPIISSLQPGVIEYVTSEGKSQVSIMGGFVEVQKNEISICVEMN